MQPPNLFQSATKSRGAGLRLTDEQRAVAGCPQFQMADGPLPLFRG